MSKRRHWHATGGPICIFAPIHFAYQKNYLHCTLPFSLLSWFYMPKHHCKHTTNLQFLNIYKYNFERISPYQKASFVASHLWCHPFMSPPLVSCQCRHQLSKTSRVAGHTLPRRWLATLAAFLKYGSVAIGSSCIHLFGSCFNMFFLNVLWLINQHSLRLGKQN